MAGRQKPGPSLGKPRIYSGPDVPTTYNPDWQYFKNLTPAQIGWFQAQPEWQNFLAYVALSPKTATVGVPPAVVNSALQAAGKPVSVTPLPSPPQPLVIKSNG